MRCSELSRPYEHPHVAQPTPRTCIIRASAGPHRGVHLVARSRALSVVERSDGFRGMGVRANISHLSHIPESAVGPAIIELCRRRGGDARRNCRCHAGWNAAVPCLRPQRSSLH